MIKRIPIPKCDCGRPAIATYQCGSLKIHICKEKDDLVSEASSFYKDEVKTIYARLVALLSCACTKYGMTEITADLKLLNTIFAEVSRHNHSVLPFEVKIIDVFSLKCEGFDALIEDLEKDGVLKRHGDKFQILPKLQFFRECWQDDLLECAKELAARSKV